MEWKDAKRVMHSRADGLILCDTEKRKIELLCHLFGGSQMCQMVCTCPISLINCDSLSTRQPWRTFMLHGFGQFVIKFTIFFGLTRFSDVVNHNPHRDRTHSIDQALQQALPQKIWHQSRLVIWNLSMYPYWEESKSWCNHHCHVYQIQIRVSVNPWIEKCHLKWHRLSDCPGSSW